MRESLEELKAIRDGAPDGATHVEIFTRSRQNPYFYKRELKVWCHKFIYDWWDADNEQWLNSSHPSGDMRSLSDINRIIELMEFIGEVGLDLMLELRGKVNDNSDERINQIARNGGDGEHYEI